MHWREQSLDPDLLLGRVVSGKVSVCGRGKTMINVINVYFYNILKKFETVILY